MKLKKKPANINRAAEIKPCATDVITEPNKPQIFNVYKEAKAKFIWLIEEYAMTFFKSYWVKQFIEGITQPKTAIIKIKDDQYLIPIENKVQVNLINPYIPNFSNIPASITEPEVEVSV